MTMLKYIDRIALLTVLSISLAIPATALACSAASARSDRVAARVPLPDGGESRFYTTGPAGTKTCRVDLSATGEVLRAIQVLTDGNFNNIKQGMTAAEVFARIGPPYDKMHFARSGTTSWDYHFTDLWNYDSDFSVIFDDQGIVVGKFTQRNGQ